MPYREQSKLLELAEFNKDFLMQLLARRAQESCGQKLSIIQIAGAGGGQ